MELFSDAGSKKIAPVLCRPISKDSDGILGCLDLENVSVRLLPIFFDNFKVNIRRMAGAILANRESLAESRRITLDLTWLGGESYRVELVVNVHNSIGMQYLAQMDGKMAFMFLMADGASSNKAAMRKISVR